MHPLLPDHRDGLREGRARDQGGGGIQQHRIAIGAVLEVEIVPAGRRENIVAFVERHLHANGRSGDVASKQLVQAFYELRWRAGREVLSQASAETEIRLDIALHGPHVDV